MGHHTEGTRVGAMRRFLEMFKDERGATAVEYGLIIALVFLAMIAGVTSFAQSTMDMWNYVADEVSTS